MFGICASSNVTIHICICQLLELQLISKFKVDRRGNTYIANWLRQDTCQRKTHVVEHIFVPGIMFMQAELWDTKLKLLYGDIYVFFQERIRPCFNTIHWPRLRTRFYMCDGCSSILHYKLLIENRNLQYVCRDTEWEFRYARLALLEISPTPYYARPFSHG